MKGNLTALSWLPMIFLSLLLSSCQKTKYPWQPGISAPKYYPVAGNISFGNAGQSSNTSFANGWSNEYGGVIIRVWFTTIDQQIEVAKAELKGYRNDKVGVGLKTQDFETWGNTYTYWQHHGIPYEAWANNEKGI